MAEQILVQRDGAGPGPGELILGQPVRWPGRPDQRGLGGR
jgi:hypothetical protein